VDQRTTDIAVFT